MKRRLAAVAAALSLGLVVPASSALAFHDRAPVERRVPAAPFDADSIGPVWGSHGWCAPSSAAEGDANRQTRPVKQYGQTSGGSRAVGAPTRFEPGAARSAMFHVKNFLPLPGESFE